jgi:hypothetical protein
MILKAFLSRCPAEKRGSLERFLPERERRELSTLPEFGEEITFEGFSNGGMLEQVHWSWFLPTLKTFSKREQGLFLSALSPLAREQLAQALEISGPLEEISAVAISYLRSQLQSSLVGAHEQLLPVEYLPPSPLNQLLNLSKKELSQLVDRLALYDVAAELRHIVETKTLKKISSCLTEEQKERVKWLSTQKEAHPLPKLGLDQWDGSEESFRTLLHRRGLQRLAIALSGQDPDLIWALSHHLDIGRGNTLFKLCGKEKVMGASEMIQREIEELLR